MVEENFETWVSKTLQNSVILLLLLLCVKCLLTVFANNVNPLPYLIHAFCLPPPLCQKGTPPASLVSYPPCVYGEEIVFPLTSEELALSKYQICVDATLSYSTPFTFLTSKYQTITNFTKITIKILMDWQDKQFCVTDYILWPVK